MLLNGMESVIKDPTDLESNWNINGKWTSHCESTNKCVARALPALLRKEMIV